MDSVGPVCEGVFLLSGIWRSVVETDSNRFMVSLFVCQIDLFVVSVTTSITVFRNKYPQYFLLPRFLLLFLIVPETAP